MSDSLVVSFIYVLRAKLASEISRALQPASMGSRLTLILVGAAIIFSVALLTWVFLRSKAQPKRRRMAGSNSVMEYFPQPEFNALFSTLLNMFMDQMMQSQQDQRQHESDQLWMMQESADNHPTVSDHTWDF